MMQKQKLMEVRIIFTTRATHMTVTDLVKYLVDEYTLLMKCSQDVHHIDENALEPFDTPVIFEKERLQYQMDLLYSTLANIGMQATQQELNQFVYKYHMFKEQRAESRTSSQ